MDDHNLQDKGDSTGWSMTHDNQYTKLAPLVIADGATAVLTSNGGGVLTNSEQVGAWDAPFYNEATNQVEPPSNEGDILEYRVSFQATPQNVNVVGHLFLRIQDTPIVEVASTHVSFIDGSEHLISLSTETFTLQNFIDNSATIELQADGGTLEIYDFKLLIYRSFIGR